jgi:uncharacterized protein YecE (DUF72 family)
MSRRRSPAPARIGTSGWHYDAWVGTFYPDAMQAKEMLAYYCRQFGTVEVNNTFYRVPRPGSVAAWRDATPADFLFACKASRFTTHMKKLKDPARNASLFFAAVEDFGDKLGPILFQLPPRWRLDLERLASFMAELPKAYRYAFEFRERSWLCDPVYDLLQSHNAALCIYDFDGYLSPDLVTADFVYVRLHGPAGRYKGSYTDAALEDWARRLQGWARAGCEAFCYFDNDEKGYAAQDALRLKALTEGMAGPVR